MGQSQSICEMIPKINPQWFCNKEGYVWVFWKTSDLKKDRFAVVSILDIAWPQLADDDPRLQDFHYYKIHICQSSSFKSSKDCQYIYEYQHENDQMISDNSSS